MDDFKRAIYIEARNQIARKKFGCICNTLEMGFDKVIGTICGGSTHYLTNEEMEYFFSELFAQFDMKYWTNLLPYSDERNWRYEPDSHSVWMDYSFITERLALLDLLIDERL